MDETQRKLAALARAKPRGAKVETRQQKWDRLWEVFVAANNRFEHAYTAEATKEEHRTGRLLRVSAQKAWDRLAAYGREIGEEPPWPRPK